MAKFIVHHLNNSRSLRIIWLLEELNLDYEVKKYTRTSNMRAPKELLEVHPLGKSPVVTIIDSGKELVLAESAAIVEYIITRYGQSLAIEPSSDDYAKYLYYLHMSEGTLMPSLMVGLLCHVVPKRAPFIVRPIIAAAFNALAGEFVEPALIKEFNLLETELKAAGGEYFVGGKLTGADVILDYPVERFLGQAPKDQYPTLRKWLASVHSRSAFLVSEEKGGKNDLSGYSK